MKKRDIFTRPEALARENEQHPTMLDVSPSLGNRFAVAYHTLDCIEFDEKGELVIQFAGRPAIRVNGKRLDAVYQQLTTHRLARLSPTEKDDPQSKFSPLIERIVCDER